MNRPERRIQGDFSLPCSTLAFPLGGRWHGAAVTDEGAGFGLNSLYAGGFRRLRAASDFARGGKVTKTPPGTAPDEHFVLIVAFPRTPLRGTRTCWILQHFRRAKSEWRSEISTGPLRRRGFRIPRFARIGQSSLTPSLLLSNANPLRWALRWGPPSAACLGGKFQPVRFNFYAWPYRPGGGWSAVGGPVWDRPLRKKGWLIELP